MNQLDRLARSGQMFGFSERGELISVQDLLSRKMGRDVDFSESVAYVLKMRKKWFVEQIRAKSKQLKHQHDYIHSRV